MNSEKIKVAFIGGGNMARAMISGLIQGGLPTKNILVCSPTAKTRNQVEENFGVVVTSNNCDALSFADITIIAVKPNVVATVCNELRDATEHKTGRKIFVSVAAGINIEQLKEFSENPKVVSAMPNLPSAIGEGVTGLFASQSLTKNDIKKVDTLMSVIGTTIWLDDESDMPSIVAAAGSAPAYFYLFMEALEKTAIAQGLSEAQAYQSVLQTAIGAAGLAKQTGTPFSQLRQQVTSPKGTTEQGVNALMAGGIDDIVKDAMEKVALRSRQLTAEVSGSL